MRTVFSVLLLLAGLAAILVGLAFLTQLSSSSFDHTSLAVYGTLLLVTGVGTVLYGRHLAPKSRTISRGGAFFFLLVASLTIAALTIPDVIQDRTLAYLGSAICALGIVFILFLSRRWA